MTHTTSRLFTALACGAAIFALIPRALSEPFPDRAVAGPASFPAPERFAATNHPPALTVTTIRYHDHRAYTRVVLVMDGAAVIKETKRPSETTIALAHSRLSARARRTITHKDFPRAIAITSRPSDAIDITLDADVIRKHTLLTLRNPHRVVVDLYYADASKSSTPRKSPEFRIVIDPGHGGRDPGAIGKHGTQEKTVVLQVATALRDVLRQRLKARVFLTRSTDVFLNLSKRVRFAAEHKADLFISIHANSYRQRSIQGMEIYYYGQASDPRALAVAARENGRQLQKNDPPWQFILADKLHDQKIEASRNLAWTIKETLIPALQKEYPVTDHGVKTAPFHVLRSTPMPGILAEIGFISNPAEEQRLRNADFQKKLAEGIYHSIRRCIRSSDAPCIQPATSTNTP